MLPPPPLAARPRRLPRVPARSALRAAGWVTHAEPRAAAASQAKPTGAARSEGRADGKGEPRAAAAPSGAGWMRGTRCASGRTCPGLAGAGLAPATGRETESAGQRRRCRGCGSSELPKVRPRPGRAPLGTCRPRPPARSPRSHHVCALPQPRVPMSFRARRCGLSGAESRRVPPAVPRGSRITAGMANDAPRSRLWAVISDLLCSAVERYSKSSCGFSSLKTSLTTWNINHAEESV